jgi:hypothetical protein
VHEIYRENKKTKTSISRKNAAIDCIAISGKKLTINTPKITVVINGM